MSYQDIIPRLLERPKGFRMHIPSPTERYHLLAHVFFSPLDGAPVALDLAGCHMAAYTYPPKSCCHNPPIRFDLPHPRGSLARFRSRKSRKRNGVCSRRQALAGTSPPSDSRGESGKTITRRPRPGGKAEGAGQSRALLYVSNWSDFELSKRSVQGRNGGRGGDAFLNGPPSCCRDNTAACHWQRNARRWPLRHPSWAEKSKENR